MLLRSLSSACFVEFVHPDFNLLLLIIVRYVTADVETKEVVKALIAPTMIVRGVAFHDRMPIRMNSAHRTNIAVEA
jgi:hypothetical protein